MPSGVYKHKITQGMFGKKHTEESRKEMKKNHTHYWKGKKRSEKTRKKISKTCEGRHTSLATEFKKGKNHPFWQGGLSPYPTDWADDLKEVIRKRDNYVCRLCGIHQDELDRKLDCHHIDYDKDNLSLENLISLCRGCHIKTNYNRNLWLTLFKK